MAATAAASESRPGRGLMLATCSYGLFSLQDATVKWLVQDYSVFQVLFTRSLVVTALAVTIGRRPALRQLRVSRNKAGLALRAALILLAWFLFFTASRDLGFAELTTLYFAAPVFTVILSVVILKERVAAGRWLAVALGFAGVAIAAQPGRHGLSIGPALLTLAAAAVWSFSGVLARLISRQEGTMSQMIASNGLFVVACATMLPHLWRLPGPGPLTLMLGLGLVGGLGQLLMYEGYRWAPASLVAPTEYTAFIWAFPLGYAIWGDVPAPSVWFGAVLILGAGVALLWSERTRPDRMRANAENAFL